MNKKSIINRILALCFLLSAMLFTGCGKSVEDYLVSPDETYEKASVSAENYRLVDKDSLYDEEKDLEVVTMYLTVGLGNEEDGTNHTWTEVNQYPLAYYEEHGLTAYKCEAALQIGDEVGPLEGEFGYGITAANATVQLRGEKASTQLQKSYRIDIKQGKGKWEEQKAIVLNKHFGDPTRLLNKLSYSLMEDIPEMISARTRFVHLYVKDKTEGEDGLFVDYGLYTQVEQINKTYLKNHNFDNNGQLYKAEAFDWNFNENAIVPSTSETYDLAAFEQYLEVKGDVDHTKLIQALEAVNDEAIPISQTMEKHFDKWNVYYWLAFHMLMGNKDVATENYYLYSPQAVNKLYFISWDNDNAFYDTYEAMKDEYYSASWNQGIFSYVESVLFRRIFQDEFCRTEFTAVMEELKDTYLSREIVEAKAQEYAGIVKPYLYRLPDQTYARVTESNYDLLLDDMTEEIEKNYRNYMESLEQTWPFHILTPVQKGSMLQLRWEDSYAFKNAEVTYSVELAKSYNFTDCIVEKDGVKGTTLETELLAPGQYFLRVRSSCEGSTPQDAFEYYITENGPVIDSTLCFYVHADGSMEASVYIEE